MTTMYENYQLFLYIQTNFSKDICDQIFGNLSDHMFEKWESCDGNIINFLNRLDNENCDSLFRWGLSYYKLI
jgi:hypothetical protein